MDINKIKTTLKNLYHIPKASIFNYFSGYIKRKIRLISKDRIIIKKIDGINYELHLNQLIDSSIYYSGCFEIETTNAIKKILKPGMIALDIGANIGCHTLPMAKIVGSKGKVIAFEPMKWPFKKLKRNIELNNFNNIIIENIALSDKREVKEILFRSSWTLDNTKIEEANEPHKVQLETLDEYIKKHDIERVDFIKLDVDGYEYKILRGASGTLKKFKPTIIMELGIITLENFGDNIEDLITFLSNLGYYFYSEKNFRKFPDKKSLIKSIPNTYKYTLNIIVHSPRRPKSKN
ncbi:MAG: FkbM family methyltransferase [Candidatus Helarchaeota archaeon]|nr:FkbM family methyltransferase [Candidatus Helarchaeota archaeon]